MFIEDLVDSYPQHVAISDNGIHLYSSECYLSSLLSPGNIFEDCLLEIERLSWKTLFSTANMNVLFYYTLIFKSMLSLNSATNMNVLFHCFHFETISIFINNEYAMFIIW